MTRPWRRPGERWPKTRPESCLAISSAILTHTPAPMSPEIPREFEKLVQHCLRKDPARRFQHIDDLKVALEEMKEESKQGKLEQFKLIPKRKLAP